MNQGMLMGGGNLKAILASGSLMFLFYTIGWSIMGTICLIAFLIVGFNSLFPCIALFLWFLILCFLHFNDGILIGVLIFWIVLLILFECAARVMIAEEKDSYNQSGVEDSGHNGPLNSGKEQGNELH